MFPCFLCILCVSLSVCVFELIALPVSQVSENVITCQAVKKRTFSFLNDTPPKKVTPPVREMSCSSLGEEEEY